MIFVTGGTGMLGSRLLYDLALQGKKVRALRRKNASLHLFDYWISDKPELSSFIEWTDGDLLDIVSMEEALNGIDIIYHCAAMVSFDPKKATEMEAVNIEGTANFVNLALAKNNIKYFCHVSSVASLGRMSTREKIDEHSEWIPGAHNSNYAISKYGAEREVWRGIAEGLPAVIVNPSIILGPGNWNSGSAEIFSKILKGFPFYTDGITGVVDVKDVSAAMLMLSEKNITNERYLLNADNISFKDLFFRIAEKLNAKKPSVKVSAWLSAIVWRMEFLRTTLTGKSPFITKESAHSAHQTYRYSSEKIKALGFRFSLLDQTLQYTSEALLKSVKKQNDL